MNFFKLSTFHKFFYFVYNATNKRFNLFSCRSQLQYKFNSRSSCYYLSEIVL